jgi:hypothetical protein
MESFLICCKLFCSVYQCGFATLSAVDRSCVTLLLTGANVHNFSFEYAIFPEITTGDNDSNAFIKTYCIFSEEVYCKIQDEFNR